MESELLSGGSKGEDELSFLEKLRGPTSAKGISWSFFARCAAFQSLESYYIDGFIEAVLLFDPTGLLPFGPHCSWVTMAYALKTTSNSETFLCKLQKYHITTLLSIFLFSSTTCYKIRRNVGTCAHWVLWKLKIKWFKFRATCIWCT